MPHTARGFIGSSQTTLTREIVLSGNGVHSGAPVSMVLHPAEADVGIRFVALREGRIVADIPADFSQVCNATLCTVIGHPDTAVIATVEHLLAALRGLSVDNVVIEVDSGEIPIMDGSSSAFVAAIDEVGVAELDAPRKFIKVLKPIRVEEGDCWGELAPHTGFHLDVEIDFETPLIGRQRRHLELNPGAFRAELSRARTFGFMKDVEGLWRKNLALGASLDNTVALGDDRILNPEGLRYSDEFVRHKMLDAVGDLALAGAPLLCAYRSYRGGHRLNTNMLKALFADRDAWTMVHAPRRRDVARAGHQVGAMAANFAADRS
ncbi:MAG: UDP-3-O-acyl-N-acetylglucosamine deacetylase [Rhizobiales bacterium]|nr:UDP-3-O-acyl-N-acetylglucosamine deacetylase [Hyphomicrobiales bacterium]